MHLGRYFLKFYLYHSTCVDTLRIHIQVNVLTGLAVQLLYNDVVRHGIKV